MNVVLGGDRGYLVLTVMRSDNGNIAERSMCTLEPELIHKGGEFRIIAPVIHSIIITLAVYFNDIVDW